MQSDNLQKPSNNTGELLQRMTPYLPQQDYDWTNEVHDRLNGTQRNPTEYHGLDYRRSCVSCFSILLIFLSVFFCIFLLLLPAFGDNLVMVRLFFAYPSSTLVGVLFGLLIFVTGIVGVVSSCCGKKASSVCLSLLLGLIFLILLVLTTLYSALHIFLDVSDIAEGMWRNAVKNSPSLICEIQKTLSCSGFLPSQCCVSKLIPAIQHNVVPCYIFAPDGTTTIDPTTLKIVNWPLEYCVPSCESNIYDDTCKYPISSPFDQSGGLILLVLVAAIIMILVCFVCSMCRSCKIGRHVSYYHHVY